MSLPNIESALYDALTGDANIAALVGTVDGSLPQVFNAHVPDAAAEPYLVFYITAGGPTNDTPRANFTLLYTVEVVARDSNTARMGADYVYTALHGQSLTLTGWHNYALRCVGELYFVDDDDGVQRHRRILEFEVNFAAA